MSQMSFGDAEYAGKRKQIRREVFLGEMEQVIPWKSLLDLIEPFYPEAGRGRHPYPLATMLRVHLTQNWFGLSDPAMEEALYEITQMPAFAGLSLSGAIPDETAILLETNELAPEILGRVNAYLARKGLRWRNLSIYRSPHGPWAIQPSPKRRSSACGDCSSALAISQAVKGHDGAEELTQH